MNCHEIDYILDSTAAELLHADQKKAIDHHFDTCDACRKAWATYDEMSALQIPGIPKELHPRIAAALGGSGTRAPNKSLIIGGVLVIGAAFAATVAIQIDGSAPEPSQQLGDSVPEKAFAPPAGHMAAPTAANQVENTPEPRGTSESASLHMTVPLDPNTIVVLLIPNPDLDTHRASQLDQFYKEILRHLQSVQDLNVISPQQVAPFLASGTFEEEIARELGAAHLVVLSTSADPLRLFITPFDVTTGDSTGSMGFAPPFDRNWPAEISSDAADVAEFIKDGLTELTPADRSAAILDARAVVLNSSLPPGKRIEALGMLPQTPEARTEDIVLAAVELATIAPNLRASIWSAMYGVDNPYLIDPLINSLIYDAAEHGRRWAAVALSTFVAEPRAEAALEQARDSDISEAVRKAALLALSTVEERDQLALGVLLDEELPARDRLMATVLHDGRNVREVTLTAEAAQAVFEIGVASTDAETRAMAWGKLGRSGATNPAFLPVLIKDLSNHSYVGVRTMAVFALRHYSDEPEVRTALEQAENDRSFKVRDAARTVLGRIRESGT